MASEGPTLVSLLGAYNNLDEPTPSWNRRTTILGIVITFMVISAFCTCIRLYIRAIIVKSLGWDDFFVTLFMISGCTGSVFICILTQYGLGKHFILLDEDMMSAYLERFYIANATYAMSTTLMKLSLLFQYLRVFKPRSKSRRFTVVMIIVIAVWGLTFSFLSWFPCFPVQAYWHLTDSAICYAFGSRNAIPFIQTYEAQAGLNMTFDVIVLAIPISIYFDQATPTKTRRGLVGLLAIGTLINIFGVWRLITIIDHRAATSPTFDPTWYAPPSMILACLEIDAAAICASVPIFWPALSASIDRIFVTKEIIITRSHRRASDLGDAVDYADNVRLQRSRSTSEPEDGLDLGGSLSLNVGSETSLTTPEEMKPVPTVGLHYNDSYVQDQVDPLRQARKTGVEVNVTVGEVPKRSNSKLKKQDPHRMTHT